MPLPTTALALALAITTALILATITATATATAASCPAGCWLVSAGAVGSCGAKNEMLSLGSWARARATQQVLDGWHRRLLHASPSLSVSTFHTLLLLIVWTASSGVVDWRCPWCNVGATSHEKFGREEK
jgi:hypothetical protein